MYHLNYFSTGFPEKLSNMALINGHNKETASIVSILSVNQAHLHVCFFTYLLFLTIAPLRFQH